jgi:5-oxoprolinase (ATP-hydrolysing)
VDERIALDEAGDIVGTTGERLRVETKIDHEAVREQLQSLRDKGINSIAVVFLHSFLYPQHEHDVAAIARQIGFTQISLSSELMQMVKMVPRGYTACADAYLTPCISRYIQGCTEFR